MSRPSPFLSAEHRRWLGNILRREMGSLSRDRIDAFTVAIDATMRAWQVSSGAVPMFRATHDTLRSLWLVLASDDPPIGAIRLRVTRLPPSAIAVIETRARRIWPRLFGVELQRGDLLPWCQASSPMDLINGLRVAIAEGGTRVPGRRRAGEHRSRPHLEPRILGVVRGGGPHKLSGRPRAMAEEQLVMHLALDWLLATGHAPEPGRSDGTAFGDLVHLVFNWLGLSRGTSSALRRYWASVAKGQACISTASG